MGFCASWGIRIFFVNSIFVSQTISINIVSSYLREILKERGLSFTTPAELEIVRNIKETMCYVVGDYDAAMKEADENHACEKNYELPDGRKILIGNERFGCPEILFNTFEGKANCNASPNELRELLELCHVRNLTNDLPIHLIKTQRNFIYL